MERSSSVTSLSKPVLAQHLQLLIDHSPVAIAILDRDMRYLLTTRHWLTEHGLGDRDLTGLSHYDVFPETTDDWKAIYQQCLNGEIECYKDTALRLKDSARLLHWQVIPWHQPNGHIGGLMVTADVVASTPSHGPVDIAIEQRNLMLEEINRALEQQVAVCNARLDGFFELVPDILCIAGFDGYFQRINPTLTKLLGYSQAELLASPFLSFVHPDDQANTRQRAAALSQGDAVVFFENRYRHRDGSYRWLSWTSVADPERQVIYATARDITEEKRTQAALKHQAQLLDQITGAIITTDLAGHITSWSRGAEALYGYSAEAAIGVPFLQFDADPDCATSIQHLIQVTQQTGHAEVEAQHLTRDRGIIDVSLSLSLEKDATDATIGLIAYVTDIGDRKRAQIALAKEQQFLKALIDNIEDGIVACDEQGVLTLFNRATREFYGIAEDSLPPDQWAAHSDLYTADGSALLKTEEIPLYRAFQGEKVRNQGIVIAPKVGPARDILTTGQAVFNDAGEKLGAVIVMRDVTQQKRAAEELSNLKDLYEQILDAIPDLVLCKGQDSQVLYGNKALREYYGLTRDQLQGQLDDSHRTWADVERSRQEDNYVLRTGIALQVEEPLLRQDGTEQLFLTTKSAIFDAQGTPVQTVSISRNITKNKAAETQLKQQEQFLRGVFDGSEHAIFVVDIPAPGVFQYSGWNLAAEKSLGIPQQAVLNKTPVELFGDAQGKKIQAKYQRCVDAKQAITYEERLYTSGKNTWWFTTINPLLDEDGTVFRLVGTSTDISNRKRTERELLSSQKFQKLLLDTIPINVFWKDRNSVYLGCNLRAAQLANLDSPDEIVGKTDLELPWSSEDSAIYQTRDREILASGKAQLNVEETITYADGTKVWLNSHKVPLRDSDDNIIGILATIEDISDRKQSEIRLQAYANRQAILNQITEQIRTSLDFDTIIDTTLQAIRQLLAIDICGFAWYSPEHDPPMWEVIQDALSEGIPSTITRAPAAIVGPIDGPLMGQNILKIDDVDRYPEPIHRGFLQQAQIKSELLVPIQNQSGQLGIIICSHQRAVRPWTESEVTLLKAVGDQLAIAIDQATLYAQSRQKSDELEQTLRELKRAQVQMVQSEKMSSLGQLVAGVAHEINNPVNFIYGNLNHAKEYTDDLLKIVQLYQHQFPEPGEDLEREIEDVELGFILEDLPKLLTSMKVGADRIRSIVSSLRIFSRMDEAEMKAVDIHEGIDSTLMILQNRLKQQSDRSEIQLIKTYGSLPLIECYAGQLNQVFMNILSNAIDALEDALKKGQIETPTLQIRTALTEEGEIEVAIADNGPGIDPSVQQRIFDPFFTTKPVGQGTGMGLSISYQIVVDKHGGTLVCNSSPQQGTEFIITIPQHQRSAEA